MDHPLGVEFMQNLEALCCTVCDCVPQLGFDARWIRWVTPAGCGVCGAYPMDHQVALSMIACLPRGVPARQLRCS